MATGARRRGASGQRARARRLAALSLSASVLLGASVAVAQRSDRSDWGSTRGAPRTLDEAGVSLSAARVERWGESGRRPGFALDVMSGFRSVGHAPFFDGRTVYGLRVHAGGWALSFAELMGGGVRLGPARAQALVGVQLLGASKLDGPARLVLPSPTVGLAAGFLSGNVTWVASLRRTHEWRWRDDDLVVTTLSLSLLVTER